MTNTATTTDDPNLDRLYQATVAEHQAYLERLQEAFNARCEAIREEAHQKIQATDDADGDARKAILEDEQKKLDQTLAELKYAVNKSSSQARSKLEEIEEQRDAESFNLESELSNIK